MNVQQEVWGVEVRLVRDIDGFVADCSPVEGSYQTAVAQEFFDELVRRAADMRESDDWRPGHSQAKDF